MTFSEAKDQAAYTLYSKKFIEVENSEAVDHRLRTVEYAAELYARQVAEDFYYAGAGGRFSFVIKDFEQSIFTKTQNY